MATTLGLDLGPNSIGWALIDDQEGRVLGIGTRVFPEGVDNFDSKKEKPRNEDRRDARMMRRQTRRRAARRRRLRQTLIEIGLLPENPHEQEAVIGQDPYALRAKALDQPLSRFEMGRVLLHLNQRRGFESNRKKEQARDAEAKGILAEMSGLDSAIKTSGARTLGEYLHRKAEQLTHMKRQDDDHIRNRHTLRRMLRDEFD